MRSFYLLPSGSLESQTYRQTDRQTDRHTLCHCAVLCRQTDRHYVTVLYCADRQTHIMSLCCTVPTDRHTLCHCAALCRQTDRHTLFHCAALCRQRVNTAADSAVIQTDGAALTAEHFNVFQIGWCVRYTQIHSLSCLQTPWLCQYNTVDKCMFILYSTLAVTRADQKEALRAPYTLRGPIYPKGPHTL